MINLHKYVAILIDADNVEDLSGLAQVLKIAEYYGQIETCRAYGDWTKSRLSSWYERIETLKIGRIQVDRIGKNATDHRLLVEAGEILGDNFWGNEVSVFVFVSGDGGFASACEYIRENGKQIIGIGNQNKTSVDLQNSCDKFYYLEDLAHELSELEKRHPIPPNEVRAFFNPLLFAYRQLDENDDWIWVSHSQLGKKLHEIVPDYKNRFGKYSLSDWLRNYYENYETHDQMVRRIDPNPDATRHDLLIKAYIDTKRHGGQATLSDMGKAVRRLARDYESQFGGKKLSKWIEAYPDTFKIDGDDVIHRNYW